MRCIPCEYKKAIEAQRLQVLRTLAKNRAKENNEYYCIYFDEEDKKYMVTDMGNAESQGYRIAEIISPY